MQRPIFIDFETNASGEVFLAAVSIDRNIKQYISCPELALLSALHPVTVTSPEAFAREICELSKQTGRPLAGFTLHDSKVLSRLGGQPAGPYLNLARAAKRWIRTHHLASFKETPTFKPQARVRQSKSKTWSLLAVARWLKAPVPSHYGYGKTTLRIDAIRKGLRSRNSAHLLTPTQKRKARHLLAHNAFDAAVLEAIYDAISKEDQTFLARAMVGGTS